MKVVWDVDGTVLPQTDDERRELRPFARDVIETLEGFGIENYVWSRAGEDNACEAARRLGISRNRCFAKPEFETPEDLGDIPITPDLVIDDDEDESVLFYPHVLVSTYMGGDEDRELLDTLPKIRDHFDAVNPPDNLNELKVKFKRRKRATGKEKMKRKRYYRRHRSKYKRYRKRYRRRPRTKRQQKIRRRLTKRYGRKLRRFRMRVSL